MQQGHLARSAHPPNSPTQLSQSTLPPCTLPSNSPTQPAHPTLSSNPPTQPCHPTLPPKLSHPTLPHQKPTLEPKLIVDAFDAVGRMRLDDAPLLESLEMYLDSCLERGLMHEAQAASCLEALGAVQYVGRTVSQQG